MLLAQLNRIRIWKKITAVRLLHGGKGGDCHIWAIQVCAAGNGLVSQVVYSSIGFINQNIWVQNRVSFFRKLIGWLKILSTLGKQLLQDRGNLGSLLQYSKIQLNQFWYRLRVPGSQRHIPTQKFLKYPPPPAVVKAFSYDYSFFW